MEKILRGGKMIKLTEMNAFFYTCCYSTSNLWRVSNAPKVIFLWVFLFFSTILMAQSGKRSDLEQKRQTLMKQIEQKNQQLKQTQTTKEQALDRLEILQDQIETRESLINNLHEEVNMTDSIIQRTEGVIEALNQDRQSLQNEYVNMMRKAYKMKMPSSSVLFMLSSKNFGDAYKRWQYFRQYDKFRTRQAQLIAMTQKSLVSKNTFLTQQKAQKEMLATTSETQKVLLTSEKQQKDALLGDLRSDEERLTSEIKSAEAQSQKIASVITKIISDEIEARRVAAAERARKEAERMRREAAANAAKTKKYNTNKPISTPTKSEVWTESNETLALSSDFRSNKGKLPTPTSGTVVRDFGRQKVLDKVTAINNGIDIKTAQNVEVLTVFSGNVSAVYNLAGIGGVVLVQHGSYYTVYSNLSSVYVKKGDAVSTQQVIGKTGMNAVTNQYELHFELWLEKTKLNPSSWLVQ
jgi:murein hydrolase activator